MKMILCISLSFEENLSLQRVYGINWPESLFFGANFSNREGGWVLKKKRART